MAWLFSSGRLQQKSNAVELGGQAVSLVARDGYSSWSEMGWEGGLKLNVPRRDIS